MQLRLTHIRRTIRSTRLSSSSFSLYIQGVRLHFKVDTSSCHSDLEVPFDLSFYFPVLCIPVNKDRESRDQSILAYSCLKKVKHNLVHRAFTADAFSHRLSLQSIERREPRHEEAVVVGIFVCLLSCCLASPCVRHVDTSACMRECYLIQKKSIARTSLVCVSVEVCGAWKRACDFVVVVVPRAAADPASLSHVSCIKKGKKGRKEEVVKEMKRMREKSRESVWKGLFTSFWRP